MTLLMRGEAYHQIDAYEQALSDFNRGLAASPTYHDLYIARARLYISIEQPDLTVADCNKALNLYPNSAVAYLWRGIAYYLKKSFRLAEEDLSKTLTADSPSMLGFHYRAKIFKEQGRIDEALADRGKVLELKATAPFEREMQQEAAMEINKVKRSMAADSRNP